MNMSNYDMSKAKEILQDLDKQYEGASPLRKAAGSLDQNVIPILISGLESLDLAAKNLTALLKRKDLPEEFKRDILPFLNLNLRNLKEAEKGLRIDLKNLQDSSKDLIKLDKKSPK